MRSGTSPNCLSNCNGATFILLLIFTAVAAGAMVATQSYFEMQKKLAVHSGLRLAKSNVLQSLTQLMSISAQCTRNLAGLSIANQKSVALNDGIRYFDMAGTPIAGQSLQEGTGLDRYQMAKVSQLSLESIAPTGANVYSADVKVGFDTSAYHGLALQPATLRGLSIFTDGSGVITGCSFPLETVQGLSLVCPAGTLLTGIRDGKGLCTDPASTTSSGPGPVDPAPGGQSEVAANSCVTPSVSGSMAPSASISQSDSGDTSIVAQSGDSYAAVNNSSTGGTSIYAQSGDSYACIVQTGPGSFSIVAGTGDTSVSLSTQPGGMSMSATTPDTGTNFQTGAGVP